MAIIYWSIRVCSFEINVFIRTRFELMGCNICPRATEKLDCPARRQTTFVVDPALP